MKYGDRMDDKDDGEGKPGLLIAIARGIRKKKNGESDEDPEEGYLDDFIEAMEEGDKEEAKQALSEYIRYCVRNEIKDAG
jgi:DNA-binding GntR family transcriptional regulator